MRLEKVIGVCAGVALVAAWFLDGTLRGSYVHCPRHPVLPEGRTVALAVKGVVVYITPLQHFFLSCLTWTEIACALIIAIVFMIHRGDPFRSSK